MAWLMLLFKISFNNLTRFHFNNWFSVFVKNTHVFSDVVFDAIFSFS